MLVDPEHWKWRVCQNGCAIHDDWRDCEGPVQGAHVIPQQTLKRNGLHEFLWDTRNGIGACYKAHRRSDGAVERFPRERIPQAAEEFAEEHGLGWKLDKIYPRLGDTVNPGSAA